MKVTADSQQKISVYSGCLKIIMQLLMIVVPAGLICIWLFIDKFPDHTIDKLFGVKDFYIRPLTKTLGVLITLIPSSIAFLLFNNGYKLFALYQKGMILVSENVNCYRKIGLLLILQTFSNVVTSSLYTIVLTMHNAPGHRSISLGIGSGEFSSLIGGFFLMIIAWVMEEAQKAKEELELTI